jgi:nickel-dependent lactate racemase
VAEPCPQEPLEDPVAEIVESLGSPVNSPPLVEIVADRQASLGKTDLSTCIVISDHTRPVPSHIILPPILDLLHASGITKENITILVGTGLHRGSSPEELVHLVGEEILRDYTIVNHDAKDDSSLADLGTTTDGTPVLVNRLYVDADLKILTGYTEPHFFAGFAGGRKAILPGIAGEASIRGNHSAAHIGHDQSRFVKTRGNPLHEDMLEAAKKAGADFIVNVCLDEHHRIVKVATGELEAAHQVLVDYMNETSVKAFDDYYDIVIVNNGGYPLDQNLYQAVKSMAIGEMAVKEGGVIIAANEQSDGVGSDEFEQLITQETDPKVLIDKFLSGELVIDGQWQVQILSRVLLRADIYVVSAMTREQFEPFQLGLIWASSVEEALDNALEKLGRNAKILVLPAGPQVIPCVKDTGTPACEITPRRCGEP